MSNTDPFDAIVADLDFAIETPEDVVDATALSDPDLAVTLSRCKQELLKLGEMLSPRSERGRELHSERVSLVVEMRRRKLLG